MNSSKIDPQFRNCAHQFGCVCIGLFNAAINALMTLTEASEEEQFENSPVTSIRNPVDVDVLNSWPLIPGPQHCRLSTTLHAMRL